MGSKTRLSSYCTKRANIGVNLVMSRKINTRLARPIKWYKLPPCLAQMCKGNCIKGRVVCGTVYGDMHLKYLLGSIPTVGYCILVPTFYQVHHGLRCQKSTIKNLSIKYILSKCELTTSILVWNTAEILRRDARSLMPCENRFQASASF